MITGEDKYPRFNCQPGQRRNVTRAFYTRVFNPSPRADLNAARKIERARLSLILRHVREAVTRPVYELTSIIRVTIPRNPRQDHEAEPSSTMRYHCCSSRRENGCRLVATYLETKGKGENYDSVSRREKYA